MESKKQKIAETCPARCKDSERCYGKAVFLGKPGKSKECDMKCLFVKNRMKLVEPKGE